jgi:hypothetical protein
VFILLATFGAQVTSHESVQKKYLKREISEKPCTVKLLMEKGMDLYFLVMNKYAAPGRSLMMRMHMLSIFLKEFKKSNC